MSGRLLVVGRVIGVHGVKGWLKLHSHTLPIDNILRYRPWHVFVDGIGQEITPAEGRMQGKALVVRFEGVDDRDQAMRWAGAEIRIDRSQLPPPKKGEVYWVDLEGLKVRTTDGQLLGTVDHLFATSANDVLVVKGDRERLIPYVMDTFVKSVDLEGGEMVVDWDPEF
jgi:16S rRNA processing protein RimM